MSNPSNVTIKGIKNGILVELNPHEPWLEVTEELAAQIDAKSSFFTGSKITVDLADRPVPKYELTSLKALLERRGLSIWSVMSNSQTTIDAAHTLDLKTNVGNTVLSTQEKDLTDLPVYDPEEKSMPGVMIRRTLRSGRTIHSEGHVVVVGDVNPGAKIIADGDIIIWGRLRGTVHAGANGDEEVVVCALDMSPTQLRIASYIVTSPKEKRRNPKPEVARIHDQKIIVESWR